MSKSLDDPSGTIMLSDSPELAKEKIMAATTDSVGTINYDKETQPGITNLLNIYSVLGGFEVEDAKKMWCRSDRSYMDLKQAVSEEVEKTLKAIQSAKAKVSNADIESKLIEDEKKINEIANKQLGKVQAAIGLID
jgi:tryptophanyl-tRNA synthetase